MTKCRWDEWTFGQSLSAVALGMGSVAGTLLIVPMVLIVSVGMLFGGDLASAPEWTDLALFAGVPSVAWAAGAFGFGWLSRRQAASAGARVLGWTLVTVLGLVPVGFALSMY
ncbi:MAG: hypothetical protein AAGA48_32715 [Myxococcota bacterium]